MKTFKIESGIKISKKICPVRKTKTKSKYPFSQMKVGDSFFIKGNNKYKKVGGWGVQRYYTNPIVKSLVYEIGKYRKESKKFQNFPPAKFSYRKVEGGFRCWRIK